MERKVTLISIAQTAIEPGLRSISAYLKRNGYKVIIIFLKIRFEKTIPQSIIDQIIYLSLSLYMDLNRFVVNPLNNQSISCLYLSV